MTFVRTLPLLAARGEAAQANKRPLPRISTVLVQMDEAPCRTP